jgi:hypothetical protein
MNESEYYAGDFTDDNLDALADAGEFYLDEWEFTRCRPKRNYGGSRKLAKSYFLSENRKIVTRTADFCPV